MSSWQRPLISLLFPFAPQELVLQLLPLFSLPISPCTTVQADLGPISLGEIPGLSLTGVEYTSLCLSFLPCKMGIMALPHAVVVGIKQECTYSPGMACGGLGPWQLKLQGDQ